MLSSGLQGTLISVRATLEGFGTVSTGIIMSLYYGGYLAGCVFAPSLVKNVGHIRVFAAMSSLLSTTSLLHGLFVNPMAWSLARIVTGFSAAALYIVVESWINDISTNKTRGKLLGSYLLIFYLSMMGGQYLLNLAPPQKIDLFILSSILVSVALLPIALSRRPGPAFEAPTPAGAAEIFRVSPYGTIGVFIIGITLGVFYTIGPVFAIQSGLSISQVANFMALFVFGGVLAQIPVGFLSDHMSRRTLITVLALLSAATSLLCFVFAGNMTLLYTGMVLLGAFSLCIYPVCVAYTNDFLRADQYVGASSKLILISGMGAFIGPFIVSVLMNVAGREAFFLFLGILFIVIVVTGLIAMRTRAPVSVEDQADYIPMPVRGTPIAAQIAEESEEK